jgi:hypothetical protein
MAQSMQAGVLANAYQCCKERGRWGLSIKFICAHLFPRPPPPGPHDCLTKVTRCLIPHRPPPRWGLDLFLHTFMQAANKVAKAEQEAKRQIGSSSRPSEHAAFGSGMLTRCTLSCSIVMIQHCNGICVHVCTLATFETADGAHMDACIGISTGRAVVCDVAYTMWHTRTPPTSPSPSRPSCLNFQRIRCL